jgi:hypothetical protein
LRKSFLHLFEIELNKKIYYLIAFCLSAAYVLNLFPVNFIVGKSGFWFNTNTDPTQHITGMWAFIHDRWHFPLLFTTLLNYPEGVSVAFTDSIPLAAIPFKLIHGLFPAASHYFGFWVLTCYLIQGVVGAYCVAALSGYKLAGAIAGTLFAVMMPSLMIRIPHAALSAQFMLLLALIWYFKLSKQQIPLSRYVKLNILLLLLASTIHPYFVAMLYPIFAASILAHCLKARASVQTAIFDLLLPLPLLAFSFYCLGYLTFDRGLPLQADGFESSSMNLISPFLGATQRAPSYFLPSSGLVLDATGGQIDGHNYLGVALMLMLGYIVVNERNRLAAFFREHWVMLILMVGFTIYSLSSAVYFLDHLVLHYEIPSVVLPVTKIFRASGRFFWPVGYAFLLIALIYFLSRPRKIYRIALIFFVALQYIDTVHYREHLAEAASRLPHFAFNTTDFDYLIKNAKVVYLMPTFGCGSEVDTTLFVQYLTSFHGVPFNTGFIARINSNCNEKNNEFVKSVNNGNLFIFIKDRNPPGYPQNIIGEHFQEWCREHPIGTVCQIGGNAESWSHVNGKNFTPAATSLRP